MTTSTIYTIVCLVAALVSVASVALGLSVWVTVAAGVVGVVSWRVFVNARWRELHPEG